MENEAIYKVDWDGTPAFERSLAMLFLILVESQTDTIGV